MGGEDGERDGGTGGGGESSGDKWEDEVNIAMRSKRRIGRGECAWGGGGKLSRE